jgi:hypothetical protein
VPTTGASYPPPQESYSTVADEPSYGGAGYGGGHPGHNAAYGPTDTLPELPDPLPTAERQDAPRYTGPADSEFTRPADGGWPAPPPQAYGDPGDPRQQQLAQAYQQAQSYQRSREPEFPSATRQPEYPSGPQQSLPEYPAQAQQQSPEYSHGYGSPLGHPQTFEGQQPNQSWDDPQGIGEKTVRFDPKAHRQDQDATRQPSRPHQDEPIDPTAIYVPERSASERPQVIAEEDVPADQVGQGTDPSLHWYGSDRR